MKLGEVHALRNISPLSRSSAAASKLFNCRQKKLLLVHFHSANNTMIFTLTRLPILFSILTFAAFLPRNKTRPTMRSGDKQQTTTNTANTKQNLDNWKSSRRKRVEHIIDRAVETKKLELEEHDRMRRKSKTFTEMMEERQVQVPVPIECQNKFVSYYMDDKAP